MTIQGTGRLIALALLLVSGLPAVAQESGSDERDALAVAHAALAAISDEDMLALTDLMIAEAVVFSVSERGGSFRYSARTRAEERAQNITRDLVERGFDAQVRIAGGVAIVWLPYDLHIDRNWSHCGVDIFTLVRVAEEWRIASMAWSTEQPPACQPHPAGPPGG